MKTVKAYMNHGRWLVDCPKHGNAGALEITEQTATYIPPCCYPQSIASMPGMQKGKIVNIPDKSARATAHKLAEQADEIYTVVFPAKLEEIKAVMAARPIHNRHWTNESVTALKKENKAHGVK